MKRSKKHNYKKVVRHQACASEFDYQGWKAWGVWKGDVRERVRAAEVLCGGVEEGVWFRGGWAERRGEKAGMGVGAKDCWNDCHYPSECTWSKRFGAQMPTPTATATSTTVVVPSTKTTVLEAVVEEEEKQKKSPKTSFEDILLAIADPSSEDYLEPLSSTSTPTSPSPTTAPLEPDTSAPSMDDLLQSAKRRKRRSSGQIPLVPSPLGANPPSEEHVVRKSVSSGALLESLEREVDREGKAMGGVKGEWKEKADALVRSFREARVKLQTGTM